MSAADTEKALRQVSKVAITGSKRLAIGKVSEQKCEASGYVRQQPMGADGHFQERVMSEKYRKIKYMNAILYIFKLCFCDLVLFKYVDIID
ncbi:hypothetical protein [Pseudomonas syringae]|uniref:hypothetical protein n=1 Tax=Pseudomonas syringae TaxID=317 RepID=UPI003F756017